MVHCNGNGCLNSKNSKGNQLELDLTEEASSYQGSEPRFKSL